MSGFFQLPVQKLSSERVPSDSRRWVEESLVGPLNKVLPAITAALKRLMLSQVNVQLLEYKGLPPTSTAPAEFVSELSGPCMGLTPIYARVLDAGGTVGAPVSALTFPEWVEVAESERVGSKLRITSQPAGLSSTTKYVLRWIAVGS